MIKKVFSKKYAKDIVFIAVLLAVALVLYLIFAAGKQPGAKVIVRVNGEEVCSYSLSDSGTYPLNGGSNILIIKDGCAYLEDANCPDKLCVKQGKISRTGQCITCLPNKLTVTVYGADDGIDLYT